MPPVRRAEPLMSAIPVVSSRMVRHATLAGATVAILTASLTPLQARAAEATTTVRPGPPILYAPAAVAPQLENTGVWQAPPILVSGTSAYRDGEFLYQDYLEDDHGAQELPDPADRRQNNTFSLPNGTSTYPADRRYAENAADIVEVRVKPLRDATAIRVTMNTMLDPTLVAISVALGGNPAVPHAFPDRANVIAPADMFLTVHASTSGAMVADLVTPAGDSPPGPAATVSVDVPRRQIDIRVPHTAWDPSGRAVRLALASGLWDRSSGRYLLPQTESDATHPGGAGAAQAPAAFFNVAFRFAEPGPVYGGSGYVATASDPRWWADLAQGHALAGGDISSLFATVDFGKLAARIDDESGVPRSGPMDRILASHFEPSQGNDYASSCYGGDFNCQFQGRLQPYDIYVPATPPPPTGYGLTLLLHANSANYNEFHGSRNQREFGDRATGSIVVTPEARDPGGSYTGYAAVDVFEVWAAVARLYRLDPSWSVISGYSLGGLGTYKLGEQFPDLFARAVAIVGSPGGLPALGVPYTGETTELESLRNIPIMIWDVIPVDELNPYPEANALALQNLGYRYDFLAFPGDHLTPAFNDEYGLAARFLGEARVDPDPPHISYVYDVKATDALARPTGDFPALGLVADHAYWLSGLKLRGVGQGIVDAVSRGFGRGDAPASGMQHGAGVQSGGALLPVLPYVETYQTWGAAPAQPPTDRIDLSLTGISAVTVDARRAHVDCNVDIHVRSDGPVAVSLAGCPGRLAVASANGGVSGASAAVVTALPMTSASQPSGMAWTATAVILAGATAWRFRRRGQRAGGRRQPTAFRSRPGSR
jgi:hypothetical protein